MNVFATRVDLQRNQIHRHPPVPDPITRLVSVGSNAFTKRLLKGSPLDMLIVVATLNALSGIMP
jgi:hypothetical protein